MNKRLVAFLFENPEPLCYHEEPICADGEIVGRVTSAMFGHTVGATVAMGYVENQEGVNLSIRKEAIKARGLISNSVVRHPAGPIDDLIRSELFQLIEQFNPDVM